MNFIVEKVRETFNYKSVIDKIKKTEFITWGENNHYPNEIQDKIDCGLLGYLIPEIAEQIVSGGIESDTILKNPTFLSDIITSFYGHGTVYLLIQYKDFVGERKSESGANIVGFLSAEKVRLVKPSLADGFFEIKEFLFHENWGYQCEDFKLNICTYEEKYSNKKNKDKIALLKKYDGQTDKGIYIYPIALNGLQSCSYPKVKFHKKPFFDAIESLESVLEVDNKFAKDGTYIEGMFYCFVEQNHHKPLQLKNYMKEYDFEDQLEEFRKNIKTKGNAANAMVLPVPATDDENKRPGMIEFAPMPVHKSDERQKDIWSRALPMVFMSFGVTLKSLLGWSADETNNLKDSAAIYNTKSEHFQVKLQRIRDSFTMQLSELFKVMGIDEQPEFKVSMSKIVTDEMLSKYQTANQVQRRLGLEETTQENDPNNEVAIKTGTTNQVSNEL